MKKITAKELKNNISLSVCSQVVSMLVSFVISFLLPKFIPEIQYAYWQIYFLYVSYVGIFHFGLLDGMVLRYSKYDYDELDKDTVRGQFLFLLTFLTTGSLVLLGITRLVCTDITFTIFALLALGILIKNAFTYSSYLFQITNRIKHYAKLIVLQKTFHVLAITILLLTGCDNFIWYCLADLGADCIGIIYGACTNSELYFGKIRNSKKVMTELSENVHFGFLLLISNLAALLLVGSARMIIQWHWGDLMFGKVSLAFTISNLFLAFISAISIVLFPALKRMEPEKLPVLYFTVRKYLTPGLCLAMLLYFPCKVLLDSWLPLYKVSFEYLGILLPSILFTTKTGLLTNNYLKHYRKEKELLKINVWTVVLSVFVSLFSALVLQSLTVLLAGIVFALGVRAVWSELVVMKEIGKIEWKGIVAEFLYSVIFILWVI